MRAIEARDSEALRPLLSSHEVEAAHLSPAALRGLLGWFDEMMRGYRLSGQETVEWGAKGDLLLLSKEYRRADGLDTIVEVVVFRTPAGPRASVLNGLLNAGFVARYRERYQGERWIAQIWGSKRDGLTLEHRRLQAIGVPGMIDSNPTSKLMRWDALIAFANQAYAEKSGRGGPTGSGRTKTAPAMKAGN